MNVGDVVTINGVTGEIVSVEESESRKVVKMIVNGKELSHIFVKPSVQKLDEMRLG